MASHILSHSVTHNQENAVTWADYVSAKERVKTLNRRLGQLRRNWFWNQERIAEAEAERRDLQHLIDAHGPRLEAFNAWLWGQR